MREGLTIYNAKYSKNGKKPDFVNKINTRFKFLLITQREIDHSEKFPFC